MSRSLTYEVVMEELQQVLHDLHDLSMYGENRPFQGIVFPDVQFVWRDSPLTHWLVRIERTVPPNPQRLMEVLAEQEAVDEEIRTGEDDGRVGGVGDGEGSGGDRVH